MENVATKIYNLSAWDTGLVLIDYSKEKKKYNLIKADSGEKILLKMLPWEAERSFCISKNMVNKQTIYLSFR